MIKASHPKQPNPDSTGVAGAGADPVRLKRVFDLGVRKTRGNIRDLADRPMAWACDVRGDYAKWNEGFYDIGNWTSSFFSGMALLAWRESEDEYFLNQVLRLAPHYREKVFVRFLDTHHDLGFLASLYSVALYKLTGEPEHREVGLRAAELLSRRFNRQGNFIRAWGHLNTTEHDNLAIIDCLMNLPLLHWASRESGHPEYQAIARRHADMCLRHFIRPDDTVCHAFRFDLKTGEPLGPDNYCGFSRGSFWARGAAWAVYGFALSYGYTGESRYLDASVRLAKCFIRELDQEMVPVWDFRLPKSKPRLRDASAAAIMACGIQELARHRAADAALLQTKNGLLARLCHDDYLDFRETCRGIQKRGQVGDGPGKAQNAYTSWGDYFLMEAVSRELGHGDSWW